MLRKIAQILGGNGAGPKSGGDHFQYNDCFRDKGKPQISFFLIQGTFFTRLATMVGPPPEKVGPNLT